jgi:CubicO group peptidase (beta-lactamase class C family)
MIKPNVKKLLWLIPALPIMGILLLWFHRDYVEQVAHEGSGFSAKYLCSGVFVSGFDPETMLHEAVIPASPILNWIGYNVDYRTRTVTADILGHYPRQAVFREQLGCTLLPLQGRIVEPEKPLINTTSEAALPRWSDSDAARFDTTLIQQALDRAFAEDSLLGSKHTKAVVVLHQGKLLAERFAPGIDGTTPLMGWSMSKSVTNLLIGILVQQGNLALGAPVPVVEWQGDERRNITLNHLLRMNSGLQFEEEYGRNSDVARMLTFETNTGAFAASKPLDHPVGTHWDYSSGTSNILARTVFQQAGNQLGRSWQFMHDTLFAPLGIGSAHFEPDASGIFVGSSYLHLSPYDWARLGQFCLQDGIWNGQRLLPEGWMRYSTTPTEQDPKRKFGAHFWLNPTNDAPPWPDLPNDAYAMKGYQGQRVMMVPSTQLVVVRHGFTPSPTPAGMNELVRDLIRAVHPHHP